MSKPKAPTPPDPTVTAQAQTDQSVATMLANTLMGQVNQRGPDGSLSYNQTGTRSINIGGKYYELPTYEAVTELSPTGQQVKANNDQSAINLSALGMQQSGRLGDLLNRPVDDAGVTPMADRTTSRVPTYGATPGAPSYTTIGAGPDYTQAGAGPSYARLDDSANLVDSYRTDHSGDRKTYEDALMARIDPMLGKQRENIQRELAARGVRPGSAAYDRAMMEYGQTANDARYGAILNASGEQARLEGLDMNAANFTNAARQQGYTNRTGQVSYNNQLTGMERADELGRIDQNNSVMAQALADKLGIANFNNAAASQGFSDAMARTGREDANANNTFAMRMNELDAQDRSRAQGLNEKFAMRNAPLQELLSIMNGTALSNPNFAIAQPSQMATTDVAGINQQGYANSMAAYQQKMQQYNAMLGGLFDLGGAFLGNPNLFKKAA